jgi:diguanylate cyclase (GGDEF)-like protein
MFQRALIVDDSIPMHQLIKTHLDGDGMDFYSAFCGESGLMMAAELRPCVILLDVDLPGMDGFEVCRRLKANGQTSGIPVIFLTADFHSEDKIKGLDLGAADYVTKPFKPEELSARMRRSVRDKQSSEDKAMIDGLTGLWNQEYFQDHVAIQMAMAEGSNQPVSCIAMDVDGLKQINEQHGIPFGDEMLNSLGKLLLNECRPTDVISHFGSGWFGILLAGMNRAGASRLAEHLCEQIRRQFAYHDKTKVGLTCSFGISDRAVIGDASLLDRTKLALDRAKQNGGNCVSVARPLRLEPHRSAWQSPKDAA